jgi:hypothetical protein
VAVAVDGAHAEEDIVQEETLRLGTSSDDAREESRRRARKHRAPGRRGEWAAHGSFVVCGLASHVGIPGS